MKNSQIKISLIYLLVKIFKEFLWIDVPKQKVEGIQDEDDDENELQRHKILKNRLKEIVINHQFNS